MSQLTPDQAKFVLAMALPTLKTEHQTTKRIPVGAFDFNPIHQPDSIKNSAGVAAWFDETFAANLQKLEAIGGEALVKMVDFRGLFQLPAVGFIQLAMNHTIHHRGQLSMYLRPMGAKVPAIYGESYDTIQARLAKEGKAS